jgi:GNAT superfamily N-acetyltransferase
MFVLRWSDERVWGPDDGQAGYLHRLATHPEVAGRGIGAQLIAAAGLPGGQPLPAGHQAINGSCSWLPR